jgi:hypothetical protein
MMYDTFLGASIIVASLLVLVAFIRQAVRS